MAEAAQSTQKVHALLADGSTVQIRPCQPADREQVLRMHQEMSFENLRWRFFAPSRRSAQQAASRACVPRPGYLALAAVAAGQIVGVAEYDVATDESGVPFPDSAGAEIAVTVADGWHDRGIGTLLLEHLVGAARDAGIRSFTADTLADNHLMLKVFADLGLRSSRRFEGTQVHYTVHLDQDEHYLSAVDQRGSIADVASLQPLLRPASIAVVGAGRSPTSVGRAILENIRDAGFTGTLHAVNAHADSISSVPAYPTVEALPSVPELAILAVPARSVPDVAEECGKRGVRALVVVSSGLTRAEGTALLRACRYHGMRLVGPNCLGIVNTEEGVSVDATFAARHPLPGAAGIAVQSGGVGIALLDGLSRLGIGVSSFVSLGDKYDVSGNDLLQWWERDERTDLALLHLESFGNPRAFSRTARRVARHMPVLTVDAGRSEAGRRAAASHTAAAATPTMTRQALFNQAGIIATRTIGEMLYTAALLRSQPLPTGSSVAIVSNAGGVGVLMADACTEAGLTVPRLDGDLAEELLAKMPPGSSTGNPFDTTAAITSENLRWCVDRLVAHESVDAVLVVLLPTALAVASNDDPLRALTNAPGRRAKPVAVILPDQESAVRLLPTEDGVPVPAYADPQAAARALAHATTRARWRAEPPGTIPELADVDTAGAETLVEEYLAEHPDGGWLDPRSCAELLDRYGIRQLPWAWAENEEQAVAAARRLADQAGGTEGRGSVVLKAHWPGLVHKTEHGAVCLDLAGEAEVRSAYRGLTERFGDVMTGVLVQPMAGRGTELVAGVVQDEVFGPLVLFGLGGTATELLADHAARLAPLTDRDVHTLIAAPRCAPLLFGYRGGDAVDLAGLEQLLLRVSRMACDLPQLAEADLNPIVARPDGVAALDVRLRLLPRRARDPHLRRLR